MLKNIDFEEAAGKTIKTVTRDGEDVVIVVFTDGTCCSIEGVLQTYCGVNPLQIDRLVLDRAFGEALSDQLLAEAKTALADEIADFDRRQAEREAAKVAVMQKAAGVVPRDVAERLLTALQLVVNTTAEPGGDAVLTSASYNSACEAIAQAERAL